MNYLEVQITQTVLSNDTTGYRKKIRKSLNKKLRIAISSSAGFLQV